MLPHYTGSPLKFPRFVLTEKLGKRWRLLDSVVDVRPLGISAAELFSSVCRSEKELLVVNGRYCFQSITGTIS